MVSQSIRGRPMILACAAALLAGCGGRGEFVEVAGPASSVNLTIKQKTVVAELALDSAARRLGLMHRQELAPDAGMLFVHPRAEKLGFHMQNTLIPLSIAFLNEKGKILQIERMKPKDLSPTRSKNEVRFALEVNEGWFEKNGIGVGDRFDGFEKVVAGLISG